MIRRIRSNPARRRLLRWNDYFQLALSNLSVTVDDPTEIPKIAATIADAALVEYENRARLFTDLTSAAEKPQ